MNAFIQFSRESIVCWAITVPDGNVLKKVSALPLVAMTRPKRPSLAFSDNRYFRPTLAPVAYGEEAQQYPADQNQDPFCCNPFDHDHIVVNHFEGAVFLFKHILKLASKGDFSSKIVRPRVFVHPIDSKDRGLTDFESKGLMNLVICAGAREAAIADPRREFDEKIFRTMFKEGKRL